MEVVKRTTSPPQVHGLSSTIISLMNERPEDWINQLSTLAKTVANESLDLSGNTALHLAALYGKTDAAMVLCSLGYSGNVKNSDGNTPLHFAVEWGNPTICTELIRVGANVDEVNLMGETPIFNASSKGKIPEMIALKSHGANLNVLNKLGENPLHIAAKSGQPASIVYLLENGLSVHSKDDNGRTPLHRACEQNNITSISILIQHQADVNARDNANSTPLHVVAQQNHRNGAIASLLLAAGVSIHAADHFGDTALHIAAAKCNVSVAQVLLQAHCDANITNLRGCSPLHEVLQWDRTETVHQQQMILMALLLEHGGDPYLENKQGKTPIEIAKNRGLSEIYDVLVNAQSAPLGGVNNNTPSRVVVPKQMYDSFD